MLLRNISLVLCLTAACTLFGGPETAYGGCYINHPDGSSTNFICNSNGSGDGNCRVVYVDANGVEQWSEYTVSVWEAMEACVAV